MDPKDLQRQLDALERRVERRWRRRLVGALLIGAILAIGPAIALASHQFGDVPNSHPFHGDIDHVYDARITAGCGGGDFCPETNVNRGQMSAFLARTGGRVAYDTNSIVTSITTEVDLANVTMRAGNVPGGTAFVKLEASGYVYTNGNNETGCAPCQVNVVVRWNEGGGTSLYAPAQMYNLSTVLQEIDTFSITWVVAVPTGVDQTFRVTAARSAGTGQVNGIASLTASYYPFSGLGTNSFGAATTDGTSSGPTPVVLPK